MFAMPFTVPGTAQAAHRPPQRWWRCATTPEPTAAATAPTPAAAAAATRPHSTWSGASMPVQRPSRSTITAPTGSIPNPTTRPRTTCAYRPAGPATAASDHDLNQVWARRARATSSDSTVERVCCVMGRTVRPGNDGARSRERSDTVVWVTRRPTAAAGPFPQGEPGGTAGHHRPPRWWPAPFSSKTG